MSLSAPKAPAAPDPYQTAAAQTQSNKETAVANAELNRIDQYTPYGSSTYSITGTNADGVPQYSQTTSLSPAQQAILDASQGLDLNLTNFANGQVGRVQDAMGQGIDMSSAPRLYSGDNTPLPAFGRIATGPQLSNNFGNSGPVQKNVQGVDYLSGFYGGGPAQSDVGTTYDGSTGKIADVGSAQRTMNGDMPGLYGGNVQSGLDTSNLNAMPGINDFGAERSRMEDAMYARGAARLDPQYAQQQRDLETQLADMGMVRGSEGWNREMDNFNRSKNDAYASLRNDSIAAGGNEQSRLFGLASSARNQLFGEDLAGGNFNNAADLQKYNNAMGIRSQVFGEDLSRANLYNTAQQQDFAQQALRTQYGMNAADSAFGQNLAAGQFKNAAQAQTFGQNQAQANFAQDALKSAFADRLAQGEFANGAQNQQYMQDLGRTSFSNDALQQMYQNDMGTATMQNAQRAQAEAEAQQFANMTNSARQQYMQEQAYLRNLPINDIATLLGTAGGVQQPQFSAIPGVSQQGTDIMGAIYNSYNAQMNQYNQQMQARNATLGSIFGALGTGAGLIAMSDKRLKTDIKPIGRLANGLRTYSFRYKGAREIHFGIMAQEAMDMPGIVGINDNGEYYVNYGKVW